VVETKECAAGYAGCVDLLRYQATSAANSTCVVFVRRALMLCKRAISSESVGRFQLQNVVVACSV